MYCSRMSFLHRKLNEMMASYDPSLKDAIVRIQLEMGSHLKCWQPLLVSGQMPKLSVGGTCPHPYTPQKDAVQ